MFRKKRAAPDWVALESVDDVDTLIELMGGFLDSCIHEIHVDTGRHVGLMRGMSLAPYHVIHVLIQSQLSGPAAIELRFEDVSAYGLSTLDSDGVILGATMLLEDGTFYWADTDGFRPGFARPGTSWIASAKLSWRDASGWLGSELRYLSPSDPA